MHGWGAVVLPESCIPADTLMVETPGGIPAACGMFYKFEGVPMARLGFVVDNPELTPRDRLAAMEALAAGLVERLKERGILHATAFYDHRSFRKIFERAGFIETRPEGPELTWSPNIGTAIEILKKGKS